MAPPTHRSSTSRHRLPGALRRVAIVAAAVTGGLLSVGTPTSAQQAELPVNALAPQISGEADLAIAAYDDYIESDDLADYLEYAAHRAATARLAARELGFDEFAMIDAWKSTSLDHQRAVLAAMTQIGVPYRTNASEEGEGFDCSGLTLYAWQESGVELDRVSRDQISAAEAVDHETAKAGDLVYFPGHVMMYLGVDRAIVHSVNTGRTVEIDTFSERRTNSIEFGNPLG